MLQFVESLATEGVHDVENWNLPEVVWLCSKDTQVDSLSQYALAVSMVMPVWLGSSFRPEHAMSAFSVQAAGLGSKKPSNFHEGYTGRSSLSVPQSAYACWYSLGAAALTAAFTVSEDDPKALHWATAAALFCSFGQK
jgi:hypothetical protein